MIVVWRVTERCNLSCAFCAYDKRLTFARREADTALVERIAPLLADYRRASGDAVMISWIGGEPLLWKPVFPLSAWLREELGIAVSTTTNGTTLHRPEVRAAILSSLSELTVSVDGLPAFHNAVRGRPEGWERLEQSVSALARERDAAGAALKLRANVVLMRDNVDQFAPLCEKLANWGIAEITFNQLGGRDRPEFFRDHRLLPQDARALADSIPELQLRLARQGVRLCAGTPYLERILASSEDKAMPVSDCGPGRRFLFIDERGRVAPCHFTAEELAMPAADIRAVGDLQRLPAAFAAALETARPRACRDCQSTQVFAKFAS